MPIVTPSDELNPATLPGHELAYAQRTTNIALSSTSDSSPTDLGLSAAAITLDGSTKICVEFGGQLSVDNGGGNAGVAIVTLYSGTLNATGRMGILSQLEWDETSITGEGLIQLTKNERVYLTPAAGTYTFKLGGWKFGPSTCTLLAGTGTTIGSGSSVLMPAYIRVTVA